MKRQVVGLTALLAFLIVSSFPLAASVNPASTQPVAVTIAAASCAPNCADSAKDCKAPVKYLGENNSCACFSCEHGRRTQRIICTENEDDKIKLKVLARPR